MSRKYKFRDQSKLDFISFATIHWIDLFTRPEYSEILIESLKHCQEEKGLEVYAWCIMPSHVHLIIGTNDKPMQDILRDFKSYTSRKLRAEIIDHPSESRREWMLWMMERAGKKNGNNKGWQLWQQHNQPIELSSNEMLEQRIDYLHNILALCLNRNIGNIAVPLIIQAAEDYWILVLLNKWTQADACARGGGIPAVFMHAPLNKNNKINFDSFGYK